MNSHRFGIRRFFTFITPLLLAAVAFAGFPPTSHAGPKEFYMDSAGLELLGGANRIAIAPGANWGLFDWMQVGGQVSYQSVAFGDDSVNTTTFRFGPTFNFGGPYSSATFAFLGIAIRKGSGAVSDPMDDPGGSGLSLFVGRRFPVFGAFAFRPSAGVQMAGKMTFVANVLAASYFF